MSDNMPVFRGWIAEQGGLVRAAEVLGITKGLLWSWLERGQVPAGRCPELSRQTGLGRWDLRPGDWEQIWPELRWQPGAPLPPAERKRA